MFHLKRIAVFISFLVLAASGAATQVFAEQRIALVIGQGAYESGALPTAVNDAGLLAQTLTSAGFEVVDEYRSESGNDWLIVVLDLRSSME